MTDAALTGRERGDKGVAEAARGGALNLVGSLVNMVFSLGIVVLVTREYGASGSGVFFTAIAVFVLVGTVAKLGSETGLVFSISRARSHEQWADIRPTIRTALVPVLGLSLVAVALLFAVAALLPGGGHHTADGTLAGLIRAMAPFLPAFVAVQVLTGATRGYGDMVATTRDVNVLRPLFQLIFMGVVVASGGGLVALGVAWALPMAITAVTAATTLLRLLHRDPVGDGVPSTGLARDFWRYASVRGFAQTLQTTQDRIGVIMVGAFAGAATAGVFVAVARIVGALNLVVYAVGQALNPQISALLAVGEREGAERLVQRITAWTMLLVWPVAAVLITHGDLLLGLFGPEFPVGAGALELLAAAVIVSTAFGHLDNVLLMGGRARLSLANVAFSLVLMASLYAVLTPRYGLMGAAWAWSVGMVAYNVAPWWYVRRAIGIRGLGPEALFVAPAAIGALVAAALARVALGPSFGATVAGVVVAALVYGAGVHQFARGLRIAELASLVGIRKHEQ